MWRLSEIEDLFTSRPTYVAYSGLKLTAGTADQAEGRLEINENHHQPYGAVHGGVYCMIIETLASTGAALWAIENGMGGAMGLSNKTDFLRATTDGVLLGKATPIHRGRNQQLWQVDITRESDGKLVAQGQVRLQNVNSTEF
jgi:1,4-dihydroxy-2-naphthoyl-CoA hydrolase